jgi:hypothetical protein
MIRRLLPSCPRDWSPTLAQIQAAPELAVLAVLRASLQTAVFAVGAANPELAALQVHSPFVITDAAGKLLAQLRLLSDSIDAYRAAASLIPPADSLDEDFPF